MTSFSKKTFTLAALRVLFTASLLMVACVSTAEAQLNNTSIKLAVADYLDGGEEYGPIVQWDTSQVTDMTDLFNCLVGYYNDRWNYDAGCQTFNADISEWDVSNVTKMHYMFSRAISFNGDLSEWDVSNVTDMRAMFAFAKSFNSDLSEWDVYNVTTLYWMFAFASSFNSDLSEWDVSNVTEMDYMFTDAESFNSDLSEWDVSNVRGMNWMFWNATSFNVNLNKWDVSNVRRMNNMFAHASSFNVNLNQWDVSKVGNMHKMFKNASSFDQELCWDVSKVTNMDEMFDYSPGKLAKYPECAPDRPFSIISGLSTAEDKWCIYPANNHLNSGTKIAIAKCKNWDSFRWTVDYEGKIKNFKDPSFCIHMQGKRMLIENCVDGLHNQIWRYSSHRTLMTKNGRKGAVVEDGVAFEKAVVKNLYYEAGNATDAEMWDLQYVSGDIVPVHSYNTFRIVSDLISDDKKWCIYPAGNSVTNGMKLVLSTCKYWDTFMDDGQSG